MAGHGKWLSFVANGLKSFSGCPFAIVLGGETTVRLNKQGKMEPVVGIQESALHACCRSRLHLVKMSQFASRDRWD